MEKPRLGFPIDIVVGIANFGTNLDNLVRIYVAFGKIWENFYTAVIHIGNESNDAILRRYYR